MWPGHLSSHDKSAASTASQEKTLSRSAQRLQPVVDDLEAEMVQM